jgi:hypothetical protein
MSHVSKIELQINDLETLKAACKRMGLEFVPDQLNYSWYGKHIGDYPLPEGFTLDDLGKCHHAIKVPGASYEIGVVKRNARYFLLWDFYSVGGLESRLGKGASKLRQAYAVERVHKEARRKGYRIQENRTENSIQLILSA